MFIRTLGELERIGRIKSPLPNDTFRSARFLTAADGMGYSYNDNRVKKGTEAVIWLKYHWEANYIVSGKLEVTDLTSDETWLLEAGALYVVGPNDRHRLRARTGLHLLSVFCPPLVGNEQHDEDGAIAASGPVPPARPPIEASAPR